MAKLFRKQVPSTHTMRCFEVSARYLSFTMAAEELHLTQSAISKQVALLEELLEIELFIRVRQRLQLSSAGKVYLKQVIRILEMIEESSRQMLSYGDFDEIIHIASQPSFCHHWLVPALKGFTQKNGNIQLRFYDYLDPLIQFSHSKVDVAFIYGDGNWQDIESHKLFSDEVIPLTTPKLLMRYENADRDAIYFDNQLIQCRARINIWDHFFKRHEIANPFSYRGPVFETWSACLGAAKEECGIALVPQFLAKDYLERGDLVQVDQRVLDNLGAYYLAYQKRDQAEPKIKWIKEWVLDYMAKN